jgi:thioredoxin reductase
MYRDDEETRTMKRDLATSRDIVDVVIVGAGPYGLSIAAHLQAAGVQFRIFGSAMRTWLQHMPKGMRLKSEGFASSLYDPASSFTLADYCRQNGLPYDDVGHPVPLETFAAYGLAFQLKFVPQLEDKQVVSLRAVRQGFELLLSDGETLKARKVVAAVGISYFDHTPSVLAGLPNDLVSHSSQHCDVEQFAGREVTIVGAGASAIDLAALLHQAGAKVCVVARKPAILFHDPPGPRVRPLIDRIRMPMTGIGSSWRLLFFTRAPHLFRRLPLALRLKAVRKTLGPAPGWFVKDEVVGKVSFKLGVNIAHAGVTNGRVRLELTDQSGRQETLLSDHVISATGYKVDLRSLKLLEPELRERIQAVEHTPLLSTNFESSVPGLYFVGVAAANSFGPLLRFACGAQFTAKRISRHIAKKVSRKWALAPSQPKVEALQAKKPESDAARVSA